MNYTHGNLVVDENNHAKKDQSLLDLLIEDVTELIRGNTIVEELTISHDLWHLHTYDTNEIWLGIAFALWNQETDMRVGRGVGLGQGRGRESSKSTSNLRKIDLNLPTKCIPDDPFVAQELLHTLEHSNFVLSYLPTKKYRSSWIRSSSSSSSRMGGCGDENDDRIQDQSQLMDYYMEQINYFLDLNSIGRRYIFGSNTTTSAATTPTDTEDKGEDKGKELHVASSSPSSSRPPSSTNTTTSVVSSRKDDDWIKLLEMSPNNLNWIYFVLVQGNPMIF